MAVRSGQFFWLLAFALLAQAPGWAADRERQGQALRSAGAADRDWIANLVPSQACAGDQVHTSTGDINLDLSCNINETNRDSQSGRGVSAVSEVNSGDSGNVDVKFTGSVTGWVIGVYALSDTDNGNSGAVKVDVDGDVSIEGRYSRGIQASSLSNGSNADGSSGDVTVSFDGALNVGTLSTDGGAYDAWDVVGLLVASQSESGGDSGDIYVDINGAINVDAEYAQGLRAYSYAQGSYEADSEGYISGYKGDAGNITVNMNGPITVSGGYFSTGLWLGSGELRPDYDRPSRYGKSGDIDLTFVGDLKMLSDFDPTENASEWRGSIRGFNGILALSGANEQDSGDIRINSTGNLDVLAGDNYGSGGGAGISATSYSFIAMYPYQMEDGISTGQVDITHKGDIRVNGMGGRA